MSYVDGMAQQTHLVYLPSGELKVLLSRKSHLLRQPHAVSPAVEIPPIEFEEIAT